MRPLSAADLLSAWERGLGRSPVERALTLLCAAWPETAPEELARLSIGRRDAVLLTLRAWSFGEAIAGVAACPACAELLEVACSVADLRTEVADESPGELSAIVDEFEVRFRLPDSCDLAVVATAPDLAVARRRLFERCVVAVQRDGVPAGAGAAQVPEAVVEAVATRMGEADPQADVRLALRCPACAHQWEEVFDIVSFFWNELEAWAYRLLHDVHTLASAYGWGEAEILAMSAWRRQAYLELING